MSLKKFLSQSMSYNMARQKVLAQNIANIDTPKYKTQDLSRGKSFEQTLSVHLSQTHNQHISGRTIVKNSAIFEVPNLETRLNGNNVSSSRELSNMQQNNIEFRTASKLYKKTNEILQNLYQK